MNVIEVNAPITIDDVADVRRFVERVHKRVGIDDDARSRIVLATHELLENAVKFSSDGEAMLRVEVDETSLSVTTRNRARPAHVAAITELARELDAAQDAMMFYVALMQRAPERRGGLGLGRVAAEGEMQLALSVEGDVVEVRARAEVRARG